MFSSEHTAPRLLYTDILFANSDTSRAIFGGFCGTFLRNWWCYEQIRLFATRMLIGISHVAGSKGRRLAAPLTSTKMRPVSVPHVQRQAWPRSGDGFPIGNREWLVLT